ncbi:GMC family oxidoreductase [Cyanobium sp. CH-040]|uniref:GMC family oxidoreductase n=1 Tax=Cyanobium sp. CH-040 TaxID=2823708 RepID=UPI0020CBAA73|nr:GMC family oxidoreductase [Cyanobium sp. CH-040]MCP9927032.1 GMC family oxidoreductase [Cyanobium sp. CH-040]
MTDHFDIVIIGGGGAGCILARRLAEQCSGAAVALLEAGMEGRRSPFQEASLASVIQTWAPESNWPLQSVPQPGLEGRTIPLMQGKVLGGGTSVNAMMYVHGDIAVVEEWHQLSGLHPAWAPSRYQAQYHDLEACVGDGFAPSTRGMSGPITIRQTPNPSASALAFIDGACQAGFRRDDFNGQQQLDAVGLMQLNLAANGMRCSMAHAFLQEPLPKNLTLLLGAEVRSLVLEGNRVGRVCIADGREVNADTVIIAAGAFQTPALLMTSGIGDPNRLEAASIPCVIPNSRIGVGLSDHMRAMVAFKSNVNPGNTEFLCEAALFTSSGLVDRPEADLQINFSAGIDGFIPPEFLPSPPPEHTVIFVPILARPLSKGSVYPLGPTVEHGFGIDPAYLSNPIDLEVYVRGVELVRELAKTAALKPYCSQELCPGSLESATFLKRYAQTVWHPVGSCAMGADPNGSACTPGFRVRGTDNLFVADASILPTLPSGNPQAAIFAMAAIASQSIASQIS